jgi:tetratricopeptide (TPR) repeat protein
MVSELLTKLTQEEYELFLNQTGAKTNSRKMASLIRKSAGKMAKDEMFKRVFKKKRDASNDYLLRNELSILKKKLEGFVLEITLTDIPTYVSYYKPYVMAQWCIKKILIKEAEKYILEAMEMARNQHAWHGLLNMNRVLFHTVQYSKSSYHQKLEVLKSMASHHLDYLKEYVAEEVRYADFIKAGAYKLSANLRKNNVPFGNTSTFEVKPEQTNNKVAQFYYLKSLAYSNTGMEAVQLLQQALACLDEDIEMFLKEEERLACMATMAMEYAMAGNYHQSAHVFEEILQHPGYKNFTARNALLFNFCTTLLKIKEYKKAIKYLEELEQQDVEPIVKERIYTMKCNCYIFLQDVKGIKRILPKNLQSFDLSIRLYYRILYVIYYLIKEDFELAERELTNIKQVKDLQETEYGELIQLFDKYVGALNAVVYKEKDKPAKLAGLKKELEFFNRPANQVSQLLPGVWLIEKAETFIQKEKSKKQ